MNEIKLPSFNQALLCFSGITVMIVVGVLAFKISIHALLLLSIIWTCCHTYFLGYNFQEIKKLMSDGIHKGIGALYVFILIGVVIAAFLESGTIASIVYYGLEIIHPSIFLPAGLLFCSFMSVAVGTLMGTVATAGVILIGIGSAMGIPLPIIAGMIIAGASFGDKMSPMSDTTNLAAVAADTDLYKHIKAMLYTTIPTLIICIIIFSIIGLQFSSSLISNSEINAFQSAIENNFQISYWGFLPIVIMFGLSVSGMPAEPAMLASVISAIILALLQQSHNILEIFSSIIYGYKAQTGHEGLDILVNRGGIESMMMTILLVLFVLALGGLLDKAGYLTALLHAILGKIKSVFALLVATMATGFLNCFSTGQAHISIVLTSQLFKDKYREMGLQKYMLSRTVEESTTLVAPILPWSLGGAFYSTVLGVPVLDYLPWAFLNYLNMFVALGLAWMGFGIFRLAAKPDEVKTQFT